MHPHKKHNAERREMVVHTSTSQDLVADGFFHAESSLDGGRSLRRQPICKLQPCPTHQITIEMCRWNSPSTSRNDFKLKRVSLDFAALACPCTRVHQSNRTSLLRWQHHRTRNLTSVSVDQAPLATGKCYSVLLL